MSKQQFRVTNFRAETLERIAQANTIISEYDGQKLTARQVYYQFVSRDLIENTPRSYQNLTSILTDARYAGLVDWDAIEDRGREADVPGEWDEIEEKFELTYGEMYLLLSERMQRIARSSIQSERHPNDPDKGGDEA